MTSTTKRKPGAKAAADEQALSRREAREDAEASHQDRPATSLPGQRQRWEDEGGAPAGVISSTDATKPKGPDEPGKPAQD